MYEDVIHRMNYAKGSVFGLMLLLPAAIAFLFDLLSGKDRVGNSVAKPFSSEGSRTKKVAAYIVLALIVACVLLPILSFIPVALSENYPLDKSPSLRQLS